MTTGQVRREPLRDDWMLLGGRTLSARLLLEECDPRCDPLGRDNVLVFAGGVLTGTAAPTSGRLSVGALARRIPGLRLATHEPEYKTQLHLHGLVSLPVEWS